MPSGQEPRQPKSRWVSALVCSPVCLHRLSILSHWALSVSHMCCLLMQSLRCSSEELALIVWLERPSCSKTKNECSRVSALSRVIYFLFLHELLWSSITIIHVKIKKYYLAGRPSHRGLVGRLTSGRLCCRLSSPTWPAKHQQHHHQHHQPLHTPSLFGSSPSAACRQPACQQLEQEIPM